MTPLTAMPIEAELERVTLDVDPKFLRGSVSVRWDSMAIDLYACLYLDCGPCQGGMSRPLFSSFVAGMNSARDGSVCPIGLSKLRTTAGRSSLLKNPSAASPMFRTLVARYLSSFDLVAVITVADQMAVLPVLAATDNAKHGDQLTPYLERLESRPIEHDGDPPSWFLTYLHGEVDIDLPVRFPAGLDSPLSVRLLRLPRPCDLKLPECNALRNFAKKPGFVSIDTLEKPKSRW